MYCIYFPTLSSSSTSNSTSASRNNCWPRPKGLWIQNPFCFVLSMVIQLVWWSTLSHWTFCHVTKMGSSLRENRSQILCLLKSLSTILRTFHSDMKIRSFFLGSLKYLGRKAVRCLWMWRAVGGVCVDVNSSGRCVDVESSGKCVSMWRAVVFNLFGPKEHQISLTFK